MTENADKLIRDTANSLGNPTLPELVEKLVKDKGLKFKDASKAVYVLWKKGGLNLSEPNPPSKLWSFALTWKACGFGD